MTCPSAEKWDLLSMTLLDEPESAALLAHARDCERCRAALSTARREHTRLSRGFEAFDRDHDALREQLMAALPTELPAPVHPGRTARTLRGLGGLTMSLNTTHRRLAAILVPAACILIAVVVLLVPGRHAIALAQVLERMRLAKTMLCDYSSSIYITNDAKQAEHASHGTLSMYSDGATRAWRIDLRDPVSTQLNLPDRMICTDADGHRQVFKLGDRIGTPDTPWQDAWLERLFTLAEDADRVLGHEVVDRRKLIGFEVAGWKLGVGARPNDASDVSASPTASLQLWVDEETRLPVRLVIHEESRGPGDLHTKTVITWDRIQWDVPVDPQAFQAPPETPADQVTDLDMPPVTESALINGLRAYLAQSERIDALLKPKEDQVADNPEALQELQHVRAALSATCAFPVQLSLEWLSNAVARESGLYAAKGMRARLSGDEAGVQRAVEEGDKAAKEMLRAVMPIGLFYQKLLIDDRAPEYYGPTVQPGDGAAVLLRWKLADGQTRVIYADLHAETIP